MHRAGALFQEWIVVQWAKIEQQKLSWIGTHQDTLRAEVYSTLRDRVQNPQPLDPRAMGRRVILPSSFVGGPRYMNQLYHDGMAIVRKVGTRLPRTSCKGWGFFRKAILVRPPPRALLFPLFRLSPCTAMSPFQRNANCSSHPCTVLFHFPLFPGTSSLPLLQTLTVRFPPAHFASRSSLSSVGHLCRLYCKREFFFPPGLLFPHSVLQRQRVSKG